MVAYALGAKLWPTEMFQSLRFLFYRQLPEGEFAVHSPKVDNDVKEPRLMTKRSYIDMKAAAERWLRYSEASEIQGCYIGVSPRFERPTMRSRKEYRRG
jgi:hypothetical protein